jgi:small subunit ribosomal protein S2
VVGISHTNVDPTLADYPIPANDDTINSVKYILDKTKEVILSVREKEKKEKTKEEKA